MGGGGLGFTVPPAYVPASEIKAKGHLRTTPKRVQDFTVKRLGAGMPLSDGSPAVRILLFHFRVNN